MQVLGRICCWWEQGWNICRAWGWGFPGLSTRGRAPTGLLSRIYSVDGLLRRGPGVLCIHQLDTICFDRHATNQADDRFVCKPEVVSHEYPARHEVLVAAIVQHIRPPPILLAPLLIRAVMTGCTCWTDNGRTRVQPSTRYRHPSPETESLFTLFSFLVKEEKQKQRPALTCSWCVHVTAHQTDA